MLYKEFNIVTRNTKSKKVAIYSKYSKVTIVKLVNTEEEAKEWIDKMDSKEVN